MDKEVLMNEERVINVFEKYKSQITAFICDFVLATAFFGGLLRKSYNADTLTYMVYAMDSADERLRGGRYLLMVFDMLFDKLGIKTTDYYYICMFLSLVLLAASVALLQHVFKRFWAGDKLMELIGYGLALGIVFCNVLFIEYFMFVEMTIFMMIGFFFATLGVYFYTQKKRVTSVVMFAVGVCFYQMVVSYAAVVLVFYYMLSNDFKWSGKAVLEEMLAAVVPMSLGALDVIAIRIVSSLSELHTFGYSFSQSGGNSSLTSKLSALWDECILFAKNSFTLLPSVYAPGIVFVLVAAITVWLLAKKQGLLSVLYYLTALVVTHVIIFIVPLMEEVFYFPPRMSFLFYVEQGLMIVTAISLLADADKKAIKWGMACMVMGYMWLQMLSCSFIISGRYVANTLDMTYCNIITKEIEKYEKENNTEVTRISVVNDASAPPFYDESKVHYEQINEKIIGQTPRSAFEVWCGRSFEDAGKMPEDIYNEYFAGKNWDYFDINEQLVIRGDTAYLCIY